MKMTCILIVIHLSRWAGEWFSAGIWGFINLYFLYYYPWYVQSLVDFTSGSLPLWAAQSLLMALLTGVM